MNKIQSRITMLILGFTLIGVIVANANNLKERTTIYNMSFTTGYEIDVDVYDNHITLSMHDARYNVLNESIELYITSDSMRVALVQDLAECIQGIHSNIVASNDNFYNIQKSNGKLNKKQIAVRPYESSRAFSYMTKKQAIKLLELLTSNKIN